MLNDIRYALRTLLKSPGFTAVAILTLALGIGANTAIFSVVNGVLLRPLPFRDSERIVRVWTSTSDEGRSNHSAGDFRDLRRAQQSLSALAGYRSNLFTVTSRAGEPAQLEGAFVTAEFFDAMGVAAASGRVFSGATDANAGDRLVVLSSEASQQLYADGQRAVGQHVRVNGESHTVVGVTAPNTEWPEGSRIWVLSRGEVPPSPLGEVEGGERDVRYFEAVGRLRGGVSLAQAQQDLSRVAAIVQQSHPPTSARRDIRIRGLREEIVGETRDLLLLLQAAVGLVLLIACTNVSSLLVARATGRRRELAVRAALGAGAARLVRQLLTESVILGLLGGAAGLLVGVWLTGLLVRVLPESVPRTNEISFDRVVAFTTLLTAMATGILFGVMPALQASRADATGALRQGGQRGGTGVRALGRSGLVIGEIALTLVLLVGAGLLINSFVRLQRVDSGMRPENVTLMSLVIPQSRYSTSVSQSTVYRRLLEGLSQRGEIQAVGVGFPGPLRGSNAAGSFFIEGRATTNPSERPFANIGSVSAGFFQAMGVPMLAGRTFSDSDTEAAPDVAIASVALARKYWPGENVIGKRVRFDDDPKVPWMTIVGLVGDVRQVGLDQDAPPILYIPYQQFVLPFTNVAVRTTAPEGAIVSLVRAQLATIDPELPPGEVTTLQGVIDRSVAQPRFRTMVLTGFALVALLLAAVGVYGLISHSVTQRTREIGIRVALGAQPRQVLIPVVREGLVLALVGVAIGLAGAFAAARLLATFLFGVQPTDPLTFAAVTVVLLAVALLASYVPSRRALTVDPIAALRAE